MFPLKVIMGVLMSAKPLAVITGASSGIGLELARIAASEGHDLIICSDQPEIAGVADQLRDAGGVVEPILADLATMEGVDRLIEAVLGRPVDVLIANAGQGYGGAFIKQDFDRVRQVIDTNITGTLYLLRRIVAGMVAHDAGRVLITGSVAGFEPGSYTAVYNASKAFIDSFSFALREEIKDSRVSVTCLMPGATDTGFFKRAGMEDTLIAQSKKEDPTKVARVGWKAMVRGDGDIVSGFGNKVQSSLANVTSAETLAERHAVKAMPGSGKKAAP